MGYHQLTTRERYLIVEHKSMGLSMREIGKALCRSASTISRELRRNACSSDGRYRVEKADSYARARRWRSKQGSQFKASEVRRCTNCSAGSGARSRSAAGCVSGGG